MPIPFGPILAQAVTLSVGDRTEARYTPAPTQLFAASTAPNIALSTKWKNLSISLGYGAGITLAPLQRKPRQLTVFHSAYFSSSYAWRHTTFTFGQAVGYGSVNFATQVLGAPSAAGVTIVGGGVNSGPPAPPPVSASLPIGTVVGPGGAPVGAAAPGSGVVPNQARAVNQVVHYGTSTTSLGVAHTLSPTMRVGGEVAYVISGAVREQDRLSYPTVQGPRFGAFFGYRLDRRNDLGTTLSLAHSWSSTGASAWLGSAGEGLVHRFDERTSGSVNAGVAVSRSPLRNGFVAYSVYPIVGAGLATSLPVQRGVLVLTGSASSAPVLDPVAQAVNPRLSFGVGAGWSRDRFFSTLTASSTLSLDRQSNAGAFRAVSAGSGVGYRLADFLSVDTGIRAAYQLYQGQNVVPLTYGVFVGLSVGASTTLK